MRNIVNCIICGKEGKVFFDLGDYHVRGCNDCQLQWVEETFEEKVLEDFDYYWAKDFFLQNEELLCTYARTELENLKKFLFPTPHSPLSTPYSWLDLGCGFAYLISEGQKDGFKVTGVEANEGIVNLIKEREPLNIIHSLINEVNFPEHSFDLVTLYDVLEHLLDPRETISKVSGWIKPKGFLAIEVPDGNSLFRKIAIFQFRLTFGKWKVLMRSAFHKHPGGHRYAFTEFSLSKLLNQFGFETIAAEKVMMPFKLHLNEVIKDYSGVRKIVYIVFLVFFYYLSQFLGMEHRLKIYARKT
ncbi:MAG TPA: hypothetical protein DHV62_04705 [Elusimicrobia bacterium]|jgi:2-polyprenyl-3-methyl-5-hydroxy-6-metoxy-1,4-benzoquinol methylase|nr:hypothetical protein [Elusimicrobiota bacterium]